MGDLVTELHTSDMGAACVVRVWDQGPREEGSINHWLSLSCLPSGEQKAHVRPSVVECSGVWQETWSCEKGAEGQRKRGWARQPGLCSRCVHDLLFYYIKNQIVLLPPHCNDLSLRFKSDFAIQFEFTEDPFASTRTVKQIASGMFFVILNRKQKTNSR